VVGGQWSVAQFSLSSFVFHFSFAIPFACHHFSFVISTLVVPDTDSEKWQNDGWKMKNAHV
jgi:hypothetical protein